MSDNTNYNDRLLSAYLERRYPERSELQRRAIKEKECMQDEEEKTKRIQHKGKAAETKKRQKEQERMDDERRAEEEEAESRQKRFRHLARMKRSKAAEDEDLTPNVHTGNKRKVSTPATITPATLHKVAARNGPVPPPVFDIESLGTSGRNLSLKKLLETDAQSNRTSKARSDLKRTGAKEILMRHGFKTGRQVLLDGASSPQPSSDAGSNIVTSPTPAQPQVHQVPVTRPGGMKRMQAHGQFWKTAAYAQEEDSFVQGSSTGFERRRSS